MFVGQRGEFNEVFQSELWTEEAEAVEELDGLGVGQDNPEEYFFVFRIQSAGLQSEFRLMWFPGNPE